MKKQILTVAIAALALTGAAMAQEKRNEVSIYGDMSSTSSGGSSTTMSMVQVSYGHYLSPNMVGKLNLMMIDSEGSTITNLGAGVRMYLTPAGKKGDTVPFVGGGLEMTRVSSGGSSSSGVGFGLEGGIAMFVSETTSIDIKAYTQSTEIEGSSFTRTGVNIGATYRF